LIRFLRACLPDNPRPARLIDTPQYVARVVDESHGSEVSRTRDVGLPYLSALSVGGPPWQSFVRPAQAGPHRLTRDQVALATTHLVEPEVWARCPAAGARQPNARSSRPRPVSAAGLHRRATRFTGAARASRTTPPFRRLLCPALPVPKGEGSVGIPQRNGHVRLRVVHFAKFSLPDELSSTLAARTIRLR
jgi:hypothetical protein